MRSDSGAAYFGGVSYRLSLDVLASDPQGANLPQTKFPYRLGNSSLEPGCLRRLSRKVERVPDVEMKCAPTHEIEEISKGEYKSVKASSVTEATRNCLKSLTSPNTKASEAYETGQRGLVSLRFASDFYP